MGRERDTKRVKLQPKDAPTAPHSESPSTEKEFVIETPDSKKKVAVTKLIPISSYCNQLL